MSIHIIENAGDTIKAIEIYFGLLIVAGALAAEIAGIHLNIEDDGEVIK